MSGRSAGRMGRVAAWAVVAACMTLVARGRTAGATEDLSRIASERYREAVAARVAAPGRRDRERPADALNAAVAAWMLAARTEDARLRTFAVDTFDAFLESPAGTADRDFHVSRPFGLLVLRLHRAGLLTGMRRQRTLARAAPLVAWYPGTYPLDEPWYDCNIALANAVAAGCLAEAFADEPTLPVAAVRDKIAALGEALLATGDLDENASNYSSLGICFFLELAQREGWLDEVAASADWRRMFTRMRDIVSPAGTIPEYGDGYFAPRVPRLDFVLLLEMAARLYDDASFRDVGARLLPAEGAGIVPDEFGRGFMLLELEDHLIAAPAAPRPLSHVQMRRIAGHPPELVFDKLILRTGPGADAAMVMVDLHARGSHAHPHKRAAVGFYEVAGVPLFHNLGRRGTASAPCGNSFWATGPGVGFPGHPRPDTWNTMSVPIGHLPPADRGRDDGGGRRVPDGLDLRTFPMPRTSVLRLDNLRLVGPRGTLLLDGFESGDTWADAARKRFRTALTSTADHTQGLRSQSLDPQVFRHGVVTRLFEERAVVGRDVSPRDYDRVELDFFFTGKPPHVNLRRLFADWVDLGDHTLPCRVTASRAEQAGRDAWGVIACDDYLGMGNRLVRRLALTAEGTLVVADTFTPQAGCRGWSAGQLWQLYELDGRGADWFVAKSDGPFVAADGSRVERRMLVKHGTMAGVTVDGVPVEPATMHAPRADGGRRDSFLTTFSRRTIENRPVTAVLAVVPLTLDEDAAAVADRIVVAVTPPAGRRSGVATVHVTAPGRRCVVEIAEDGIAVGRPPVEASP